MHPTRDADLPERFKRWLREVDPLITQDGARSLPGAAPDYHRDAFIRKFWQVRDPYPETGRNELKENWDERVFQAESEFESLDDDRARILLVHGPPDATMEVRCTTTRVPVTVWLYESSEVVDFRFLLVFVRAALGKGRAAIWRPGSGPLESVIPMARECINGSRLDGLVTELRDMGAAVRTHPRPGAGEAEAAHEEWVATFQAFTAEVEPAAPRPSTPDGDRVPRPACRAAP